MKEKIVIRAVSNELRIDSDIVTGNSKKKIANIAKILVCKILEESEYSNQEIKEILPNCDVYNALKRGRYLFLNDSNMISLLQACKGRINSIDYAR